MLWGISWLGFDICVFWLILDLSGDSFADVDFVFFALHGVNCRRIAVSLSIKFFVGWTEFGWELLGWIACLSLLSDGGKIFDGFFILVLMDGVSQRFSNISAILTFFFASLTISNACASSNSICFFNICSVFCDLASICLASIFARVVVSGRIGTSTSNSVFIFLDFKGFALMDLCVLREFCDGSRVIGLLLWSSMN